VKSTARRDFTVSPSRKRDVRTLVIALSIIVCLAFAGVAQADFGLTITTLNVRIGGILRGHGNAVGMPVYFVPESRAPRPFSCHGGQGLCPPRSARPPGKPYVLLGHLPGRYSPRTVRRVRFAFRVPTVPSGRYQVVFWCKPCGGSLLLAGATLYGQVVIVRN
jgi:hypothetical protein